MIDISLSDEHFDENYKAIRELQKRGFLEAEIQQLYDRQVAIDMEKEGGAE